MDLIIHTGVHNLLKDSIKAMQDNCFTGDEETDHSKADEILIEVLEKLGYSDLVELWETVEKYYA